MEAGGLQSVINSEDISGNRRKRRKTGEGGARPCRLMSVGFKGAARSGSNDGDGDNRGANVTSEPDEAGSLRRDDA